MNGHVSDLALTIIHLRFCEVSQKVVGQKLIFTRQLKGHPTAGQANENIANGVYIQG
jgi:hypothetical protein